MTRYLNLKQVEILHQKTLAAQGGASGIRDEAGLDSAIAQPKMSFGGHSLYPTLHEKACALAFSLIMNHPFIDGNKRIGHVAMIVFLTVNGYELVGDIDEHERVILSVASSEMSREEFAKWISEHLRKLSDNEQEQHET
jgi:death on curing protein